MTTFRVLMSTFVRDCQPAALGRFAFLIPLLANVGSLWATVRPVYIICRHSARPRNMSQSIGSGNWRFLCVISCLSIVIAIDVLTQAFSLEHCLSSRASCRVAPSPDKGSQGVEDNRLVVYETNLVSSKHCRKHEERPGYYVPPVRSLVHPPECVLLEP